MVKKILREFVRVKVMIGVVYPRIMVSQAFVLENAFGSIRACAIDKMLPSCNNKGMRDFPSGGAEQIPEMDVKNTLVDWMVDDEDFNRAVSQLGDDAEYISSKLASLEDNDPTKEKLEDGLVAKVNHEIPGLDGSASFQDIMADINHLAQQGLANNQILAEAIADALTGTGETLKRMTVNTGIVTGGIMLGATGLPFGLVAIGAVAYRTFKARSNQDGSEIDDMQEVAQAVKALNSIIEDVVETTQKFALVREDFQAMWNQLMSEEAQEV